MSNKNCGPDIVKYFVVEPSSGTITGSTGDFYVCQGTTFLKTISGCTDSVNINDNIFYNNGDVYFNGIISACTGIHTSNLFGCSPITVHDLMVFEGGIDVVIGDAVLLATSATTFSLTNLPNVNNTATQILVRNTSSGLVEYRDVSTITPDTNTFVTGTTFNNNQAILTRNDGFEVLKLSGSSNVTLTNPSPNQIVIDASGVKYFISETTPTGVTIGNGYRWFNTSIGSEFVYIDDGDSSQWVQPLIQPGPQGPRGYTGTFLTTGITTSTSVLTTDYTYYGVNYIGDVDLTLPDPTGIDGVNIMIKDEGGNASFNRIRLIASVGLIDGNSSIDMVNNYQSIYIVARNNNWWII